MRQGIQGILHTSTVTPAGTESCLSALFYFVLQHGTVVPLFSLPHVRAMAAHPVSQPHEAENSVYLLCPRPHYYTLYRLILSNYAIIGRNLSIHRTNLQYYSCSFITLGLRHHTALETMKADFQAGHLAVPDQISDAFTSPWFLELLGLYGISPCSIS